MILDGTFIFQTMKYKIDIKHRLEGLLQETSLKLYILQSCIDELRSVGPKAKEAMDWALSCCDIIDDSAFNNLDAVPRMMKVIGEASCCGSSTLSANE